MGIFLFCVSVEWMEGDFGKRSNFHRKSTTLKIIFSKYYNPIARISNTKNLCDARIVCTHILHLFSTHLHKHNYANKEREEDGGFTCVHDGYQFVNRCDLHGCVPSSFHYVTSYTCYTHTNTFDCFTRILVMPLLVQYLRRCVYFCNRFFLKCDRK